MSSAAIAAIRAFNRFYTNVIGVVDWHILDSPFSLTEVRILWEIHYDEGCNPRKISETLRVDEGYLSRTISDLVKRGLVDKRRSRSDARKFALSLTDLGRETFLELDSKAGAAIESLVAPLSDDELTEVVAHMDRIRGVLGTGSVTKLRGEAIRIRTELRAGDLGQVINMHGALYAREYGYGPQFESYVASGIHEFFENYDPERDRVWICEHQAGIIGSLFLMHRENNTAQLRYFLLSPGYRGIGLGKRLMKLLMDFAVARGYDSLYLWTTDELKIAASLYRRYGFELTADKPSTAFGKPLHEQRYDLILRSP